MNDDVRGPGTMSRSNSKSAYEILGRDSVHPFPARMAPGLALDVVAECREPLRVLDPMSGSGTVLAVARSKGHHAIGVDLDPLAVLIGRVWTTDVDSKAVVDKAAQLLDQARHVFKSLRTRNAYPRDADAETRRFARYWFDDYARRQLTALASILEEIPEDSIRDVLWCAFSRLIITKQSGASLAMDLSHSRPHRAFKRAPAKPFRKFLAAVKRVVDNCIDNRTRPIGPATCVQEGDARNLALDSGSIDLVLTSPPYLNAIDYFRCSKFSLIWMGYSIRELRRLRSIAVGTEVGKEGGDDGESETIISELKLLPALETREKAVLIRYIDDMRRVVGETARVLAEDGRAVYVIGENTIRGTFIPNSLIVEGVASAAGLRCTDRRSRELPANRRYLPPPSTQSRAVALNARIRREVVLTFKKQRSLVSG